jgi:hypothetical protein
MAGTIRSAYFRFWLLLFAVLTFSAVASAQAPIRIVRLSYASGDVQTDRGTGSYEKALLNMPIVGHSHLRTGDDGEAELVFENGSTIRIAPATEISLAEISTSSSGSLNNRVTLDHGLAFVNWNEGKGNELQLAFDGRSLSLGAGSHVRVQAAQENDTLAVFDGNIAVTGGSSGDLVVHTGETITFDNNDPSRYFLSKSIDANAYDAWDKGRDEAIAAAEQQQATSQSEQQRSGEQQSSADQPGDQQAGAEYSDDQGVPAQDPSYASAPAGGANLYGSDLNAYGNWVDTGSGMYWQPYGVAAGWNPYADGSWMWYPNWGWQWVSPYPWGWLPYHYGSWTYVNGYGWCWRRPGRFGWRGWHNITAINNAGFNNFRGGHRGGAGPFPKHPTTVTVPRPPATAPTTNTGTIVSVGRGPEAPWHGPRAPRRPTVGNGFVAGSRPGSTTGAAGSGASNLRRGSGNVRVITNEDIERMFPDSTGSVRPGAPATANQGRGSVTPQPVMPQGNRPAPPARSHLQRPSVDGRAAVVQVAPGARPAPAAPNQAPVRTAPVAPPVRPSGSMVMPRPVSPHPVSPTVTPRSVAPPVVPRATVPMAAPRMTAPMPTMRPMAPATPQIHSAPAGGARPR